MTGLTSNASRSYDMFPIALTVGVVVGVVIFLFTPDNSIHYSPMPLREMACGHWQESIKRQVEKYNLEHAEPITNLPDTVQASSPLNFPGVLDEPVYHPESDCFFVLTVDENGKVFVRCRRHGAGESILMELKSRRESQVRHTEPFFKILDYISGFFH